MTKTNGDGLSAVFASALHALSASLEAQRNLARLWRDRGKPEHGRQLVGDAYAKFSEGFDTADLSEARDLLDGE